MERKERGKGDLTDYADLVRADGWRSLNGDVRSLRVMLEPSGCYGACERWSANKIKELEKENVVGPRAACWEEGEGDRVSTWNDGRFLELKGKNFSILVWQFLSFLKILLR
ncbi:hypothetical protein QQP08_005539 [Theobroma cacao]|nr:hypothetical protein QQP08_005539 [Theobroma cacao]